jgi:BirA family biotin operon repressor/biotin-[acetyl-CoA-carboxylase] ligase
MNKDILELLSNKYDFKNKSAEEILQLGITEITDAVKELGNEPSEIFSKDKINSYLETEEIGRELYLFKSVKSTNTVAKFLSQNVSNGTVILSETQTGGRGRTGKKYQSPKGGIWLSIILKPDIAPSKAPLLTLATAVAVARTLDHFNIESEIKWPNDILINEKKVCGILTESIAKFNNLESVIVGVGINSEIDISEFPEEIRDYSIALSDVVEDDINPEKGIAYFFKEIEFIYNKFLEGDINFIFDEWRKYNHTIGKYVEIRQPLGKVISGYAVGIDREGGLVIEKADDSLVKVVSGECRLLE